MARCTAPSRGHRSAAAAANCPACGGRYSRYGSGGYSSYSTSPYSPSRISNSGTSSSKKPSWSKSGSSVSYTSDQIQSLTPIRETVETRAAQQPDLRDVFLCHAWGDRKGAAKELHDLLEAAGVKVWFSEKELSTLLAGNQLIPIVHNTSYEALRNVSPMLASRTGLDTSEDSMEVVAEKIAELVDI